ncbi:hypothetical protein E2320_013221, partial [Naja naja]
RTKVHRETAKFDVLTEVRVSASAIARGLRGRTPQ